ncbi:hypothetical protein ACNKHM_28680 [Shigella sonnei]
MASGLTHCGGCCPRKRNVRAGEVLRREGAWLNWKNDPTVRVAPYEMNVTYMDALSRRRVATKNSAQVYSRPCDFVKFYGVPAIYISKRSGVA